MKYGSDLATTELPGGQTNSPKNASNRVFGQISLAQMATAVLTTLGLASLFLGDYKELTQTIGAAFANRLSYFYALTMNFYVLACLMLALSPVGKIKLASCDKETPEFSTLSWWTMLFSAGMGIGLYFYGVVEPLSHQHFTLKGMKQPEEALSLTLLHWGIHPWSCYAIIGLCFAYFSFRKHLPFSIRSCLARVLGDSKNSISLKVVETATIFCPVVGVATSLGLGALQIAKGLDYSFDLSSGLTLQIAIIIIITLLSTLSVISGVDRGIKLLSVLNMFLATILSLCVLFLLSPGQVFQGILLDSWTYLSRLGPISFWSANHDFLQDGGNINWTTFHWSAWIAWAPFVGMFIAKISRGRTIREFLFGTILVPTALSALWFSLFGRSAIDTFTSNASQVEQLLQQDLATTFFVYLSQLSDSPILRALAIASLMLFFITSSDSAALVIATCASSGSEPNTRSKIYWSLAISVLAIIFLIGGGLGPMQIITIFSACPFALISLFMIFSLVQELRDEFRLNRYSTRVD